MAWNGLTLTAEGRKALTQSQIDGEMRIKSIVVGDGSPPPNFNTQKKLVNQLFEITDIQVKMTDTGCIVTGDFPAVGYDYYFREVGIMVLAGKEEVLYVYDNCGDSAAYIVNSTSAESTEKRIRLSLIFSDVATVEAVTPSILYISPSDVVEITELEIDALDGMETMAAAAGIGIEAGTGTEAEAGSTRQRSGEDSAILGMGRAGLAKMGSKRAVLVNYLGYEGLKYLYKKITGLLSAKVDKVNGKGLSTNDYTTAEKNKLSKISDSAQRNVQADWAEGSSASDAYIKNKPTKLSQFINDEDIEFLPVNGAARGIRGNVAQNDYWCVRGGGADDNGYLEIATGDNGNEPIYVRQYGAGNPWSGGTVAKQLTLLNEAGDTVIPERLIGKGVEVSNQVVSNTWIRANHGFYITPSGDHNASIHFYNKNGGNMSAQIFNEQGRLHVIPSPDYNRSGGTFLNYNTYIQSGELIAMGAQIRITTGYGNGKGLIIRNENETTYFLLTNHDNSLGEWNSLRPISINNSNGDVVFGHRLLARKIEAGERIWANGGVTSADLYCNGLLLANRKPATWLGAEYSQDHRPFSIETANHGGYAPFMSFLREGIYGCNFGLDLNNQLAVGGWSDGPASYQLYTEKNPQVVISPSPGHGGRLYAW